jgi:hypothetical protein
MAEIHPRLQTPERRFVLLGSHGEELKKPFEKSWQETANYQYNDQKLLAHRGNYGVCGGYGDLHILDSDDLARWEEMGVLPLIPPTFTIESRPGHRQFYVTCKEHFQSGGLFDPERTELNDQGKPEYIHIGDLKAGSKAGICGGQAVGPGCRHPSGSIYQVIIDAPIAEVSRELLKSIISRFKSSKKVNTNYQRAEEQTTNAKRRKYEEKTSLDLLLVVDIMPPKGEINRSGDELRGDHPVHGSTNGGNYVINTAKNVWSCKRCESGGGAALAIAVKHGIISCSDAAVGVLRGNLFKEVLKVAREYGYIKDEANHKEKPKPEGTTVIDAIKALAGVCDGATSKDGMGFSKFDRERHDALIEKIVAGGELSRKQENTAYTLAKKYRKQLKKLVIDCDQISHIIRACGAVREDADPLVSAQREIIITGRHMQDITAESMPELIAYNQPPRIFVKSGYLVQVAVDEKEITRIELLSESVLKSCLSRCARYMRASEDGELTATDAPGSVVKDVMALPNWPGILPIVGLISSPVVRPDGSIISQPGHDAATGLYYTGKTGMALNVPDMPTQDEAVKAAAYIMEEVFGDFPFKEQASRANTLAALLTTLTLPLIGSNIPLGLFDKPQAGTGASLLTEIIAELATGEKANMQTAPDNDEEWRKAITSVLMQGPQIVVIDNVTSALKSSKLSQMLTARTWSDRMLGQTKMLNLPQTAAWFATGNNIQLGGDIARRAYWIRVDALLARPWLRDGFRHPNITEWVKEHRSELLSMLLTMVRAWIVAGKPKGTAPKIGSFVKWSQVIGGILNYAKVEGFLGNAAELYDSADQDIAQWDLFLDEWQKLHRDDKITSGMLKIELTDIQPIYKPIQSEMPEEIIKATDKGTRGAVGLGKALSRHVDQVFPSGRKLIVEVDSHTKGKKWSVTTIKRSAVDEKWTEPKASDPFAVDAVDGLTTSQNQKENISGIEGRGEKSKIIPERNGGSGGSTTASTAKRPDDSENGTLPSTANVDGDGSCPAPTMGPHPRKAEPTPSKAVTVRFKTSYKTDWLSPDGLPIMREFQEGEIAEFPVERAAPWIKRGVAEAVMA